MAMILLVYPKYVGGKFISNCLALSRHCVVQDRQTALMDIKLGERGFNENYYKFKLAAVMKTLPLKQDIAKWADYEYGCDKLYGVNEEFYKSNSVHGIKAMIAIQDIYEILKQNNRESCLITHDYRTLMKYLMVWTNSHIIEFDEYDKFRALAAKLKTGADDFSITQTPDYKLADEYHHKDQQFYQLDSTVIFSMDSVLSSAPVFVNSMRRVYENLGFTDYKAELIETFYTAYMSLHQ